MRKQAGGARFGLKPRQKLGVLESRALLAETDGFYRDGAPDDGVDGPVHNAHRAAAELSDDFVSSGFCYCFHLQAGADLKSNASEKPHSLAGQTAPLFEGLGPVLLELGIFSLTLSCGHASTDTRAPYLAQYPAEFRKVNATGVPVFRTRYVAVRSGSKSNEVPGTKSTLSWSVVVLVTVAVRVLVGRYLA